MWVLPSYMYHPMCYALVLESNESALETLHVGNNKLAAELVEEVEQENQAAFRPPGEGGPPALPRVADEL